MKSVLNLLILVLIAICLPSELVLANTGGSSSPIVLRVRLADGSMERIQLENGKESTMTLGDVLSPFDVSSDASIRVGTKTASRDEVLSAAGIQHGSMITVLAPKTAEKPKEPSRFAKRRASSKTGWNPYPELAKDYHAVVRETQKRRSTRQGMSYKDISKLQSSLHMVEPQKEGPLLRLYMCRVSAERFYSNGVVKTKSKGKATSDFQCRAGLLLGTIQQERVDRRPKKARTSLSSQTADSEYCTVAKVQAVWEPPGQSPDSDTLYETKLAASLLQQPRVQIIARHLGLVPLGWIFSYKDDRLEEQNSFGTDGPQALFGLDVAIGGSLKIQNMKDHKDEEERDLQGDRFVTLAMDATNGATEAFQLSDVAVQMVYEDMFENLLSTTTKPLKNPPTVPMRHAILVDGKETKVLDSVLCLVNTAVLSHVGSYSGDATSASKAAIKKSNGSLTNKTKKLLLQSLDSSNANDFLKEICDFNVLVALDELLAQSKDEDHDRDMEILCGLVRKWARGQKKGTVIDPKFRRKLQTYLST